MKKPLLKLVFALALLSVVLLGTPEPAHAYYCYQHWDPNCHFIGVLDYGGAVCCTYDCGTYTDIGLCWLSY